MSQRQESNSQNWLIFIVSTVLMLALLWFFPAWFWVPLPFVLTYLTKALNAM
ncbi:MAG: hypothetical protein IPQ10_12585 [Saprospiraceae bacterium]|nr:hypothetical protein [Saprospiraceae bacterium]MBK7795241.1 hypothetical protein [Saprospiraceae bacterium]MBK8153736.1 hypothetical protein [Saprospiraceae bacterium]MBL0261870.1 hypothetical protein [Saprospiraceae bacterium]MBX7163276.1 hypothetical protein [Saprospiraceae bacterium]